MGAYALTLTALDDGQSTGAEYSAIGTVLRWNGYVNGKTTFFSFVSPIPPRAVIASALLTLTSAATYSGTVQATITVLAWWSDASSKPTGDVIGSAAYSLGSVATDEEIELDITALVQAVVNDAAYPMPGRICLSIVGQLATPTERSCYSVEDGYGREARLAVTVSGADLTYLWKAVYDWFASDAGGLSTAVGGRLAAHELPSESAYPAIVYDLFPPTQIYAEGLTIEACRVQFSIFTADDFDGSAAIALASKLREAFDWVPLTFSGGYTIFSMKPDGGAGLIALDDPGRQMYVLDYELAAQR